MWRYYHDGTNHIAFRDVSQHATSHNGKRTLAEAICSSSFLEDFSCCSLANLARFSASSTAACAEARAVASALRVEGYGGSTSLHGIFEHGILWYQYIFYCYLEHPRQHWEHRPYACRVPKGYLTPFQSVCYTA